MIIYRNKNLLVNKEWRFKKKKIALLHKYLETDRKNIYNNYKLKSKNYKQPFLTNYVEFVKIASFFKKISQTTSF